jgi:hypothetical protein
MKPRIARVVLVMLAAGYLAVYAFVLFVAMATSGDELIRSPGAWYAAIAAPLYVTVAGAYALGWLKRRLPFGVLVALHVAFVPALAFSFLGLGLLLPLFAALWWFSSRESQEAAV